MQAMVHAQREQLQASPLGPHMRGMGILPPLCTEGSSIAGGSAHHSAPSTHPLDAAVEEIVEETRRESLEGSHASSEHLETKAEVGDQDATKAKKTPITSPSELSLVNSSEANSAPPPPPYAPQTQPVPAAVIHQSRAQKVKQKTKTVFRRVIGLNLPFLFIGYKHKVTVTHY
ncbi:hypothetical protein BDZ89DRAFT_1128591 [Hymenopellis radicata]|nr:hypothetical protein BDZ89DRAFT_1128591 [Hymenopellis radicata]